MENKTAVEQLIEELNDIKFNKCTTLLEAMFFDGVLAIIEGKYIELEKQQRNDSYNEGYHDGKNNYWNKLLTNEKPTD